MTAKRYNGTSFVDISTYKRWNGSAWVTLTTAKRWNGSAWVNLFAGGGGGGGSLALNPSSIDFLAAEGCTGDACPITAYPSDFVTYAVTGNTGAYTVAVTLFEGDAVTIDTTVSNKITLSASCGRNVEKNGTIKVSVTDTLGTADFFLGFSFTYVWENTGGGGGEEP
jgi:hypothetical protein